MASWKASAQQLSEVLQSRSGNESVIFHLLDTLNSVVYPIENLRSEVRGILAFQKMCCTFHMNYGVGCGKPGTMLCGVQGQAIRWRVQGPSGQVGI